jgi:hypothetical protein
MKTNRLSFFAAIALVFLSAGCQKEAHREVSAEDSQIKAVIQTTENNLLSSRQSGSSGPCNSSAFTVVLESHTFINGNWEWIWSVQNSNPGNGNNGTVQDLSHWGMQFGTCFNWSAVMSAAYSYNGYNWTGFTPSYQPDPSQSCMTSPVLKFDFGTSGSAKSYYKLVLDQDYPVDSADAYYKSGNITGCCTFTFNGVGCHEEGGIK